MGGPLGKYSQTVAAIVASSIILTQLIVWLLLAVGTIDVTAINSREVLDKLNTAFYVAIGAVFGAAASTSVNGQKIEAAHKRLDIISAPNAESSNNA